MRFPMHIMTDMLKWQAKNWWRGERRYPYVLMLEPLHTCNLACLGCSPERYSGDLKDRLSLAQCIKRSMKPAPRWSRSAAASRRSIRSWPSSSMRIIARQRHIYLCTNGILLERFYAKGRPHKRLSINVHLDGMRETHDMVVDRAGVFDKAIEMIREGKRLGYAVCTNTTVYRETSMEEIEDMCSLLDRPRHRRHPALPRLPLREAGRRSLHVSRRDPPQVPPRPRAGQALPDLVDADVPAVRRRSARLSVHALGQPDPHAEGLERAPATSSRAATIGPGRSSGAAWIGTTGSRAATRAARTASCTPASNRRSCASSARARATCWRWRAGICRPRRVRPASHRGAARWFRRSPSSTGR